MSKTYVFTVYVARIVEGDPMAPAVERMLVSDDGRRGCEEVLDTIEAYSEGWHTDWRAAIKRRTALRLADAVLEPRDAGPHRTHFTDGVGLRTLVRVDVRVAERLA